MKEENIVLSFVVPCYNEAENITLFLEAVHTVFQNEPIQYEVIFINDGSSRI